MTGRRWKDLSPRTRRLIALGASLDAFSRAIALVDLKRRSPAQVNGSRTRWAAAILLVNSGGLVPLAYLVCGRRPEEATTAGA